MPMFPFLAPQGNHIAAMRNSRLKRRAAQAKLAESEAKLAESKARRAARGSDETGEPPMQVYVEIY